MPTPLEKMTADWQANYSDMALSEFVTKVHEKMYSDIPFADFTDKLGLTVPPELSAKPVQEPTPYPGIEGAYGDNPTTQFSPSDPTSTKLAGTISNIPRSAVGVAKGVVNLLNPETYRGISEVARGGLGISPEHVPEWEAAKQGVKNRYGNPLTTFANDPVGLGLEVYGGFKAGQGLAGLGKKGTAAYKDYHALPVEQDITNTVRSTFEKAIRPPGKGTFTRTEKYYKDAQGSVESIVGNKGNLVFEDPITGDPIKGRLPTTLNQHASAIEQTKTEIFKQYDALAKTAEGAGRGVETTPIANELLDFAKSKQAIASGANKYAWQLAERYKEMGALTLSETQDIISDLNRTLRAYDRTPNPGEVSNAGVDALIRNNLRKSADAAVENSGYVELKRKYGQLLSTEKEINQRALVDARKNIKGFFDLTDIYTAKELTMGVLKVDPVRLAGAAAMNATKAYIKYMNSPNRMIKNMFEKVDGLMQKRGGAGRVAPTKTVVDVGKAAIGGRAIDLPNQAFP